MLKAIILNPGKEPELKQISNTLKQLQLLVGGNIENVYELSDFGIDCWVNEEGKFSLSDNVPNFWIYQGQDFVAGTAVFLGHDDEGEIISLNNEQISVVQEYLKNRTISDYRH